MVRPTLATWPAIPVPTASSMLRTSSPMMIRENRR
jgi:hypothetical protein